MKSHILIFVSFVVKKKTPTHPLISYVLKCLIWFTATGSREVKQKTSAYQKISGRPKIFVIP